MKSLVLTNPEFKKNDFNSCVKSLNGLQYQANSWLANPEKSRYGFTVERVGGCDTNTMYVSANNPQGHIYTWTDHRQIVMVIWT